MCENIIKEYISSGLISESDYDCLKSALISFGISSDDILNGIVKSIESIKIEKEEFKNQ